MPAATDNLTFKQSIWIATWVSLWVLSAIALLLYLPVSSVLTPALWLHLSATLLLLLLSYRLSGQRKYNLLINPVKLKWLLLSTAVGVAYWLIDHWLIDVWLNNSNNSASIESWQQANARYHWVSVFISSVIMAPVFEELFFRGLIFRALALRFNVVLAALTSAGLFALIHWSWPECISLLLVGLIYAALTHKSNSVLTPIVAHMTHNLITYLYYSQY